MKVLTIQEAHFWDWLPGGFIGTKILTCFNAELNQFFIDTIATPNSRGLGNMVQKVPFGPIFHCLHMLISFKVLHWRYSLSCQSSLFFLVLLTRRTHRKGLVLYPGYFLAHFAVEIGEDNPKPVSDGCMPHESDYPPRLWGNGPKAPSCLLHWDQRCSCPGRREITYYLTITANACM